MDKICIVKLRKRTAHATEPEESYRNRAREAGTADELSFLVSEQNGKKGLSLLNGEFIGELERIGTKMEPIVIKIQFAPIIPLRLLKSSEVVQMLRISNNYLNRIVKEGKLKSYRIGKLRRFKLDDILSYLQDNCELPDLSRNSIDKTTQSGILERSFKEV